MKQVNKHILTAVIFFAAIAFSNTFSMKIVEYNPNNKEIRTIVKIFLSTYLSNNESVYLKKS